MEQKEQVYQPDIGQKEVYEKPQISSEEVEIGVYGQYPSLNPGPFGGCCSFC